MNKINTIIKEINNRLGDSPHESACLGFIMCDINEFGFEEWLHLPASDIASTYFEVTMDLTKELCSDYSAVMEQQTMLQDIGVGQSEMVDPTKSMYLFRDGVLDILLSMICYFETREFAKEMFYEYE